MDFIDVPFFAIEFKKNRLVLFDKHRKIYHYIDYNDISRISIKEKRWENFKKSIIYFLRIIVLADYSNIELAQTKLIIKLKEGNTIGVYTSLNSHELNKIIRDIKLEIKASKT